MDWFEKLVGFKEGDWEATRSLLAVEGGRLRSLANGQEWEVGELRLASLSELRAEGAAAGLRMGVGADGADRRGTVSVVEADARLLHRDPKLAGAMFQVASQFNLLEMAGPHVEPEDGVGRYEDDRTQGPACAIAAGAATIFRNYFAPGGQGQGGGRQIDALADMGAALEGVVGARCAGGEAPRLWEMRNGYAMCEPDGLRAIGEALAAMSPEEVDNLRGRLRIGIQTGARATEAAGAGHLVSQAFCAALPVSYAAPTGRPWERAKLWAPFASLVLEGAYEAIMLAAALAAKRGGSNVVLLTRIGGGAFGNDESWIQAAMGRAFALAEGWGLDARMVSHGPASKHLLELAEGGSWRSAEAERHEAQALTACGPGAFGFLDSWG